MNHPLNMAELVKIRQAELRQEAAGARAGGLEAARQSAVATLLLVGVILLVWLVI